MKIVHFVRALNANSGISDFVTNVACEEAKLGWDVSVFMKWHYERTVASSVKVHVGERFSVLEGKVEFAHVHAAWTDLSVRAMRWCVRRGVPFVFSPHGSLMPRVFTKGRVKKWLAWHLLLKPLVKRATYVHCTSEAEAEACRALGLKGPFVVAPLGVTVPEKREGEGEKCLNVGMGECLNEGEGAKCLNVGMGECLNGGEGEKCLNVGMGECLNGERRERTVLFLGRLGEEKGLVGLLEAWNGLRKGKCLNVGMRECLNEEWRLVIAGPDWEGYGENLRKKVAAEAIPNVVFTGPADAEMKDRLYRAADVFVLPSPMENFSMVVLEALAYGVPAIATKGTPWGELASSRCGWWIDQGVEPLKAALAEAMALTDAERAEMGARGRALAKAKYSWRRVVREMFECLNES